MQALPSLDHLRASLRHQYDLAGLSDEEQDWFITFIRAISFRGWDQIIADILRHVTDGNTTCGNSKTRHQDRREWCRDNPAD
jgi:hypothetical protein